ncbi:ATP-binding protein [Trueperella pyogenes]|uniref:ATP-binding protein n=1 Tax=Trueperella pyogenes TaxID=1661 RepID=UPI00220A10A7|nr:ATP-binding protein [Trueperella pyogenes]
MPRWTPLVTRHTPVKPRARRSRKNPVQEATDSAVATEENPGHFTAQSIIYTTNLEFSRWPSVIGDTTMASAIIDRTVHHGRILRTSWRLKNAAMK